MAHRRQKRRGVLLLVSLVLLVLFLMLGVTFVLMAGNFRRSSEAYRRLQESGNTQSMAEDLLHGVAHDLVRGTHNPESPFSKENLLEDIYGQPALRGKVATPPPPAVALGAGGQFTELTITADADFSFSSVAGYYSGLVLTMVTGEAAGQSTRIVGSSNTGGYKLTVMTLPGWVDRTTGALDVDAAPQADDLILVNGRPFSGDGTGYGEDDPGTPHDDETDTTLRLNEDYDAADLNNPWLAAIAATPGGPSIMPSWSDTHTPLYNWGSGIGTPALNRPVGTQATLATNGVDNDGDGWPESIWIDAGLPLQTQSDGRLVKPLVAMLVRDLDGRVNVNAHGSTEQLAAFPSASAPIGQGYGPAEIFPDLVLGSGATGVLLQGRHADALQNPNETDPGGSGDDPLSAVAQFHHYGELAGPGGLNAFVSPHDIHGLGEVTMTAAGQLVYTGMGGTFSDDPYEMQLDTALGSPRDDSPFTPAELERVFRSHDVDVADLPQRLAERVPALLNPVYGDFSNFGRELITTESWDLPVHPVALPEELAGLLSAPPTHIHDLITARIMKFQGLTGPAGETTAKADADKIIISPQNLISREMLAGLKFNVNRLFGNGQDDNNNDVVDDPGEGETAYPGGIAGAPVPSHFGAGPPIPFSYGDPSYITSLEARQQYARQLYLLLMLCADIRNDGTGLESEKEDDYDSDPVTLPFPIVPATANQGKLLARRLAQFAVNAVDYRDADSIMTLFPYDQEPFDGSWMPTDYVWGCETPAAVLTETLALHDRRVKDEAKNKLDEILRAAKVAWEEDNPGETYEHTTTFVISEDTDPNHPQYADPHFDQYALPEGSLFLEIYCLPNDYPTRDLYESTGQLNLSRLNPAGEPVWRVAISKPHAQLAGVSVFEQLRDTDSSGSVDDRERARKGWRPAKTDPEMTEVPDADIDRIVWFTNPGSQPLVPGTTNTDDRVYYNRGANVYLTPGSPTSNSSYAVVGPRNVTAIGRDAGTGAASGQQITLDGTDVICAADRPDAWDNPRQTNQVSREQIGLSISEPLRDSTTGPYYPENYTSETPDPNGDTDRYWPEDTTGEGTQAPIFYPDVPFDHLGSTVVTPLNDPSNGLSNLHEGTVENFCTAFLQRLADPTKAYDPASNPYITVDAMPIDLTIFNGDGVGDDPVDVNAGTFANHANQGDLRVRSRERGGQWATLSFQSGDPTELNAIEPGDAIRDKLTGATAVVVAPGSYNSQTTTLTDTPSPYQTDPYQAYVSSDNGATGYLVLTQLQTGPGGGFVSGNRIEHRSSTLGAAPVEIGTVAAAASPTGDVELLSPVAMMLPEYDEAGSGLDHFDQELAQSLGGLNNTLVGIASPPLPHFPNRPFVSQYELMQVPASAPGRLTYELTTHSRHGVPFFDGDHGVQFFPGITIGSPLWRDPRGFYSYAEYDPEGDPTTRFHSGFGHLLNFFYEFDHDNDEYPFFNYPPPPLPLEPPPIRTPRIPQFGRLFDYLHVPSRYAGTQTTLRPDIFAGVTDFKPPYNRISNYREPGRVNLNTVFDPSVWAAIMHVDPANPPLAHRGATWDELVMVQGGRDPAILAVPVVPPAALTDYTNSDPTVVRVPSRSASVATYRDPASSTSTPFSPTPPSGLQQVPTDSRYPIGVNFWRSNSLYIDPTHTDTPPQFHLIFDPLFAGDLFATPPPNRNFDKHPFFRYGPISRLGNLVTTRSNVYAVWMTLGYFEVDNTGAVTGNEVGEDTGEIERHRAFYMIDRSIPVGYENGQDNNTEDVFRMQRFIE